jgi:hypothetical protein
MRNLPLLLVVAAAVACSNTKTPEQPDAGSGSGGSGGSGQSATCNNMGICKPSAPNMCSLGSAGSGPACTGQVYDYCNTGSDCNDGMCHLFQASGFSVCTTTCTAGDNSTCPQ